MQPKIDYMVLRTQQYLNFTYDRNEHWVKIEENGKTAWPTIRGLIRALQIEIGISTPNGTFGPATEAGCPTLKKDLNPTESMKRLVYILQGAMWCKGFSPGGFTGTFGDGTESGIKSFQTEAGLAGSNVNGIVNKMIWKALLNMDAFRKPNDDADDKIRIIQQSLNRDYHKWIGLRPTDGFYGRDTNKALIYAVQVEEGITEPNGTFGPTTQALLPTITYGSSQSKFVKIVQYALYCNGYDPTGFTGTFGNGTITAVREFQKFSLLPNTGNVGPMTWASLLVSSGDKDRKGTACDCSSEVTQARAETLKANGYEIVGRYIAGGEWKRLKAHEAQIIFKNGLRLFPIYQTAGNSKGYFTADRGLYDAREAIKAALSYGFPEGTTIYFAVDYDAVNDDVSTNILPYFKHLRIGFNNQNTRNYKIGVYGARNVCRRVGGRKDDGKLIQGGHGYTTNSFVCDMSTGFSGNLGYALPPDWAFDQIKEYTIGSGAGAIAIDNNICSNRDRGVSKLVDPEVIIEEPYFYTQLKILQDKAIEYANEHGATHANKMNLANAYVLQYLRKNNYSGIAWDMVAGPINTDFINIAKAALAHKDIYPVNDTVYTDIELDTPHFAATLNSHEYIKVQSSQDAAGWGGDIVTLIGDSLKRHKEQPKKYPTVYDAAKSLIGTNAGTFSLDDMLADVDAKNIAYKLDGKTTLNNAMRQYFLQGGNKKRFTDFIKYRFTAPEHVYDGAVSFVNAAWGIDPTTKTFVELLKKKFDVPYYNLDEGAQVARAFAEYVTDKASKE